LHWQFHTSYFRDVAGCVHTGSKVWHKISDSSLSIQHLATCAVFHSYLILLTAMQIFRMTTIAFSFLINYTKGEEVGDAEDSVDFHDKKQLVALVLRSHALSHGDNFFRIGDGLNFQKRMPLFIKNSYFL
jgi:hypothetical protein